MKNPFFLFIPIIIGISFLTASCHCKKKTTTASAASNTTATVTPTPLSKEEIEKIQEQQQKYVAEGYEKAHVVFTELDGCSYMLMIGGGSKLEPTNLPQEFKKDNLDVWIKYNFKKGGVSICMAGPMVELTDIQLRK